MFAKTFRSAVSALLVCCLLLGISGNAVVLAVENPASGAIDKVDAKVNATIADLEATIADLEAQVKEQEQNLADAKEELNTGKEDLADAQDTLDEKKELLDEAEAELDKLQGKLDEADEMLGKLNEKVAEYQAQLDQAQIDLDAAQVKLDDAQVQLDNAQSKLTNAQTELTNAQNLLNEKKTELENAKVQYEKAYLDFEKAMEEFLELEAKVKEMPEGPAKDAAQKELDKLGAKVTEANNMLKETKKQLEDAETKLTNAQTQLTNAQTELTNAQKLLNEKQAEKDAAQELKNQYQADKDAYQAKLNDGKKQLADAEEQVEWAKAEYQKLYDTIDEINATIDNYQDKIDEINLAVEEAEEALPVAENALAEANEALADAKTVVENIKTTYATLHDAVTNPSVSVEFVVDTVSTLNAQINELWASVLVLQTSLHELIAAYEELEDFAIDPIVIEDYHFKGLVIEPFEVGEYHYDEVNFHFYGYKFDGYTVDPVTVEGYSFEGFSAPAMPEELTKISNTLDTVIAKTVSLNATLHYYVAAAKNVLGKVLDKLGVAADITIDLVRNHLNKEGAVKVYNWLYNNPDKVCHYVKEFGVHGLDLMVTYGPYAVELLENHSDLVVIGLKLTAGTTYLTATLGAKLLGYLGDKLDFLADYKDDVAMAAAKLYAKYGDEAKALVKVYVEYLQLEERYFNATNDVYVIGGPNYYVALGDDSSESVSYVDKLAAELGVPYKNLADHDVAIQDAVANNLEELKKADLITIGYSANTAAKHAIERVQNHLMAEPVEEIDWTTLVGEKYDGMITAALNKFEQSLIEAGLDGEFYPGYAYRDLLMLAAESYLCDYLNYILDSRNAINSIQAVNDDALIVLVGMYNPYEGVVITNGDKSVNLGELYDLLVEAVDCYYLAYAFVNQNTIFVNAPAVETSVEAGEVDLYDFFMNILLNDSTELDATDAGHEYIKNQIMDALTVKTLGDVNCDGKVNNLDAMLVLRYATGYIGADELDLDVADVNFDGKYNNCDAMQILRYATGYITEFYPPTAC